MTTFTFTTSEKERRIEDMIECLRTKMDYDEFRDLAPHLGVKLQNGYYEQFSKTEKEYATIAPNIETALVDVAFTIFLRNIKDNFETRPLVDSVDDAKEFFATLLWKWGEAEARDDNTTASVYNVIYIAAMLMWRNDILSDDSIRQAFAYDYDEEAWNNNVDGRVYWVKKIRALAEQLAKEEA